MAENVTCEAHDDIIRHQIIEQYSAINAQVSLLVGELQQRKFTYAQRMIVARIVKEIRPSISSFIGLTIVDKKFYEDIEPHYLKFVTFKPDYYSRSGVRYISETIVELWEQIKFEMQHHNLIELKGE